jgi:hypothetical protein
MLKYVDAQYNSAYFAGGVHVFQTCIPPTLLAECTYSKRALFLCGVLFTELYSGVEGGTLDLPTGRFRPTLSCDTAWICGFGIVPDGRAVNRWR